MSGKKLKKKKLNNTPKRGIATGIHNAVIARLQDVQRQLMNLQQILGCYVHQHGAIDVELVEVKGDWVLVTDEIPSQHEDGRALRISLVTRAELEAESAALKAEEEAAKAAIAEAKETQEKPTES
jgi:hypothetical protein